MIEVSIAVPRRHLGDDQVACLKRGQHQSGLFPSGHQMIVPQP
jgi:hypothetical protein